MRTQQQLMKQLAETQGELRPLLARLAELAASGGFGIDDTSRNHLRNIDLHINQPDRPDRPRPAEHRAGAARRDPHGRPHHRRHRRRASSKVAAHGRDVARPPARVQCLAGLCGRAEHAPDGRHLRADGVRHRPGVPEPGADRQPGRAGGAADAACGAVEHAGDAGRRKGKAERAIDGAVVDAGRGDRQSGTTSASSSRW